MRLLIRDSFSKKKGCSFIQLILKAVTTRAYLRDVSTLAMGTFLAQAILLLASPILSRLYTPADFGVFATVMALVASLSPAVCGKYEQALVVPKNDECGRHLLSVSILFAIVISMVVLAAIISFQDSIIHLFDIPSMGQWLHVTPWLLLSVGAFMGLSYYANRLKRYDIISKSKLVQSILIVVVSLILGMIGYGFKGLVIAQLVGGVAAVLSMTYMFSRHKIKTLVWPNKNTLAVAKKYKEYPFYNASTSLLNGIQSSLPIFFMTYYYSESVVGFYAFALRVVLSPLSLITTSVSQVNLRKIVDLANSKQDIKPYLIKITMALLLIIFIPTIILMYFSQELFASIFGENWRETGRYVQILMPAMATAFVVSPLGATLGALNKNKYSAVWKVVAFISTYTVLELFSSQNNIYTMLKALAVNNILLYIFYYALIWAAVSSAERFNKA